MLLPLWSCDSQGPTNTDDVADDSFKDKENQNDILLNAVSPTVNAVSSNIEIAGPSLFMDPLKYPVDSDMPELEDIVYSEDKKDAQHISNDSPLLGVNTPRCDEDSIEFKELMVFIVPICVLRNMELELLLSEASNGFDQIVDFLNAHTIQYALMVNLTIYVSCIKQFWATAKVKKVNDVDQLQALIDGKKCISAKRTAWNEFSCSMASSVICLATGRKFNFSKYIFDNMVRNMDSPSKFLMYPLFIQVFLDHQVDDMTIHNTKYTSPALTQKVFANMRRVKKGVEVSIPYVQPSIPSAPSPTVLQDTTPTPHDTPPQYQPSTPFDSPLQDQSTTPHKSSMPLFDYFDGNMCYTFPKGC
nr:hypothetical protein [Tanacetum cinerariifolium]